MQLLSVMSACKNPCPPLSFSTKKQRYAKKEEDEEKGDNNTQLQHKYYFKGVGVMRSFNSVSPLIATAAAAALLVLSPLCNPPMSFGQQINVQKGAALFGKACIGCHYAGGNIIQPGATLFLKDLQKNNIAAEDEIYNITYYGNGRMPGFGEKCTPRGQCTFGARLNDDEIKLLAEFVKTQADLGWPNAATENYGD